MSKKEENYRNMHAVIYIIYINYIFIYYIY